MRHRIASVVGVLVVLSLLPTTAETRTGLSGAKIEQVIAGSKAKVGVAVLGIESEDTLTVNGSGRYPMQSVYKFPLALAVMHQVDAGTLSLTQKIYVRKKDLLPGTWSPLREKHPKGNVDLTLAELLTFTVAQSDNNGCDILFRMLGGTAAVDAYVHSLGIRDMAIVATEEEMHRKGDLQYENWSSPAAMGQLLRKFYRGEILSTSSTAFLRQVMEQTSTGPTRIKGMLPEGTVVAHKTGSSGADDRGRVAATNDVGVVTLPDSQHVAIVVFVSDATMDEKACEAVIARVAKAVWDAYIP